MQDQNASAGAITAHPLPDQVARTARGTVCLIYGIRRGQLSAAGHVRGDLADARAVLCAGLRAAGYLPGVIARAYGFTWSDTLGYLARFDKAAPESERIRNAANAVYAVARTVQRNPIDETVIRIQTERGRGEWRRTVEAELSRLMNLAATHAGGHA